MSVLTLKGKPINWSKPPKAQAKVRWSRNTTSGKPVIGSLYAIAHLDHMNALAEKKFGVGIQVIQSAYNSTVAASKGTHDEDMCFDVWIPGVDGLTQQAFFRANGAGAYYRKPPAFGTHIHYFSLPPREGVDVSDDYRSNGFKVGLYVDGGYSTLGRKAASSQIEDYYNHRTALAGHAFDPSWFPPDINRTLFNLPAYVIRQRNATATKGPDWFTSVSSHGPLARLGGEAGQALWDQWEGSMRKRANLSVRDGVTTYIASDTNKHGLLPNFGAGMRRIGGKGIDLIAVRQAVGGAKTKVLRRKVVNLTIDGHDGYGVKVKITLPSGKSIKTWLVQANLGRGVSEEVFYANALALYKAFGDNAVYHFNEVDEADKPNEHDILADIFPHEKFARSGWSTMSPTLVGKKRLSMKESEVVVGSPGLAKVSPRRDIVITTIGPRK